MIESVNILQLKPIDCFNRSQRKNPSEESSKDRSAILQRPFNSNQSMIPIDCSLKSKQTRVSLAMLAHYLQLNSLISDGGDDEWQRRLPTSSSSSSSPHCYRATRFDEQQPRLICTSLPIFWLIDAERSLVPIHFRLPPPFHCWNTSFRLPPSAFRLSGIDESIYIHISFFSFWLFLLFFSISLPPMSRMMRQVAPKSAAATGEADIIAGRSVEGVAGVSADIEPLAGRRWRRKCSHLIWFDSFSLLCISIFNWAIFLASVKPFQIIFMGWIQLESLSFCLGGSWGPAGEIGRNWISNQMNCDRD